MQLSSHSWPRDSRDEFCSPGRMCVFVEDADKFAIGRWPWAFDVIWSLFGRKTVGPIF